MKNKIYWLSIFTKKNKVDKTSREKLYLIAQENFDLNKHKINPSQI